MQLPQLAQNCPLGSLTWPTRSATVGFCAHHRQIAICIFKGVSAAFAEHKLSHMSHERNRRMTAAFGDRRGEARLLHELRVYARSGLPSRLLFPTRGVLYG